MPEKILAILKACTRFDNNPEYGPDGDLSYGRPSIDALLNMLEMLGKGEDLRQPAIATLNSYANKKSLGKEIKSISEKFIAAKGNMLDECVFGRFRLKR